jgi:hypothetical protein
MYRDLSLPLRSVYGPPDAGGGLWSAGRFSGSYRSGFLSPVVAQAVISVSRVRDMNRSEKIFFVHMAWCPLFDMK